MPFILGDVVRYAVLVLVPVGAHATGRIDRRQIEATRGAQLIVDGLPVVAQRLQLGIGVEGVLDDGVQRFGTRKIRRRRNHACHQERPHTQTPHADTAPARHAHAPDTGTG
jgi:hypothetical protein